jgi:arylsulfatase
MEGSLRVPFIVRWPGRVPAGRVSNEIVHEVDTFTTLATIAGARVPRIARSTGRPDRLPVSENRGIAARGFPVFVADRLEAVKWRNWKVVFYESSGLVDAADQARRAQGVRPHHRSQGGVPANALTRSWVAHPAMKILKEIEQSLAQHPPIAPGTPDPYTPRPR